MSRAGRTGSGRATPTDGVLGALARAHLTQAEGRAATFVRENVDTLARMNIAEVAAGAGVSEPTVVRLCRSLGCQGFPDFKIRLAAELASGTPYVHSAVSIGDPTATMVDKILASTLRDIADFRSAIELAPIETAIGRLASARRIDCFGTGLACAMAMDAQIKLMRVGIPTLWYPDGDTQAMAAANLGPGDVALMLTVRGTSSELMHVAGLARGNGATVIGVSRAGAPLAACCDVFVGVRTSEDTEIYPPSYSRLLVLLVVDILTTGLIARMGPKAVQRLRNVKEAVRDHPRSNRLSALRHSGRGQD